MRGFDTYSATLHGKILNMKKIFIAMCMALIGLCATAQEKGDMAVGVNLGVAPCLES